MPAMAYGKRDYGVPPSLVQAREDSDLLAMSGKTYHLFRLEGGNPRLERTGHPSSGLRFPH